MFYSLFPAIVGIYFLLGGLFVFLKDKRNLVNLTFSLLCFTTFIWQGTWAILFQAKEQIEALILVKIGYFFIIFLPTFLYHFLVEISESTPERKYVYTSYVIDAFFALTLLCSDHLFVNGVYTYYWGFYPRGGILHPLHVLQTSIIVSRGLWIVFQKTRALGIPDDLRNRLKYCVIALLIYFSAAVDYLCNYGFEFYPPGIIFIIIALTIIAYAITKYDLMQISVVITKTTAMTISIFVSILSSLTIFILIPNPIFLFLAMSANLVFWSLKFQDFRLFLQTTLEKKFLKNRYNYAVVIQRFVDGFGKCSEIGDVAQVLKSTFNDEMEIADVRVYFPEFFEMTFRTSGTFVELISDADQTPHTPLTTDTKWIQTLCDQKTILISSELTELANLGIAVALPCFEGDNLVCLVLLGKKLSEDGFKPEDVSLFSTIASQIPAVLDRIHRSRASVELDLAQRIQTEILPKAPEIPGLELACYMKPADEVGGDYYDVVVAGEYAWVLLGDVTGHGLGSGLVMFMAQSILTSILQTREQIEPAELNYLANQILYKNLQRLDEQLPMTFVSLCFHEGRSFTVSGCHDNFLIYRAASQSIEMLSLDHFALGIGFSDSFVREDYTQSAYTLEAGDVIFMVTDGITEAFCGGNVKLEQYGEERLKGLFLRHAAGSAEEVKAALIAELDEFTGGIYHDDVTFIVAKAVEVS